MAQAPRSSHRLSNCAIAILVIYLWNLFQNILLHYVYYQRVWLYHSKNEGQKSIICYSWGPFSINSFNSFEIMPCIHASLFVTKVRLEYFPDWFKRFCGVTDYSAEDLVSSVSRSSVSSPPDSPMGAHHLQRLGVVNAAN